MKVLFLDIDGVLNSQRSCVAFNGYPHEVTETLHQFDIVALNLIRRVCAVTGCKVVLSSSWRYGKELKDFENLNLPMIDFTPRGTGYRIRGGEIKEWLEDHPEVTHYAIVDDNSDMLEEQLPNFVKTQLEDGLSWNNFKQLIEILEPINDEEKWF